VVSNTEAGLVELRAMMADRRLADSKRFAHVRQELGIGAALAMVKQHQDSLRAAPASLSPGAAAATEQPGSTGPADKGTAITPDRGRGGARTRRGDGGTLTSHTRRLFLRPEPSVPRCSLRGRSGARRPRHARAEVGGRCAWLRAAPLLPSPPLRAASLLSSGRDGKAGVSTEPES
jgi:hypothetical protein